MWACSGILVPRPLASLNHLIILATIVSYWIMTPNDLAIVPLVLCPSPNSHHPLVGHHKSHYWQPPRCCLCLRKSRIHLSLFTMTFDASLADTNGKWQFMDDSITTSRCLALPQLSFFLFLFSSFFPLILFDKFY